VRVEMIVRGDRAERLFECGSCGHSWRVPVASSTANDKERAPRMQPERRKNKR